MTAIRTISCVDDKLDPCPVMSVCLLSQILTALGSLPSDAILVALL